MFKIEELNEEEKTILIDDVFEVLDGLENLGKKTKAKLKLLKNYKENPYLYFFFKQTYDPTINFYIKPDKFITKQPIINAQEGFLTAKDLCHQLSTRKITGNEARDTVQNLLEHTIPDHAKWYYRLFDRDLHIGITLTNAAKIWPKIKSSFGVQAAKEYDPKKAKFPLLAEPKIDGERFVASRNEMIQRSGKNYTPLLKHISALLGKYTDKIIDGEFFAHWEKESLEDQEWEGPWNKTSSFLSLGRKAGGWTEKAVSELNPGWYNRVKTEGVFWIFDYLSPSVYELGQDPTQQEERRRHLIQIYSSIVDDYLSNEKDEQIKKLVNMLFIEIINLIEELPVSMAEAASYSQEERLTFIRTKRMIHEVMYAINRALCIPVYLVPQYWCFNEEEVKYIYRMCLEDGWEGIMLKDPNAPYLPNEKRRDWRWMKYKPWETVDAKIIGFIEGKGKHEGRLGAFEVELPNGEKTRASGKMIDDFREYVWANRQWLIDEYVELKQQADANQVTTKARFPIFLRLREK